MTHHGESLPDDTMITGTTFHADQFSKKQSTIDFQKVAAKK